MREYKKACIQKEIEEEKGQFDVLSNRWCVISAPVPLFLLPGCHTSFGSFPLRQVIPFFLFFTFPYEVKTLPNKTKLCQYSNPPVLFKNSTDLLGN